MGERIRDGEGTVPSSGRNREHGAAGGCRRILRVGSCEQRSSQERADPGDNGRVESRGPHSPRIRPAQATAGLPGAAHCAARGTTFGPTASLWPTGRPCRSRISKPIRLAHCAAFRATVAVACRNRWFARNRGARHGAMRRGQAIARCRSHSPAMRSISGSLSWRKVSLPFLVMSQSKCSRRKPGGRSRRAAGRDGAGAAHCAVRSTHLRADREMQADEMAVVVAHLEADAARGALRRLPGAWLLPAPAGTVGNVARGSPSFGYPKDLPAPGMTVAHEYRPAGSARRPPSRRGPGCAHSRREPLP